MIVLSWVLNGFLILAMITGVVALLNAVAKALCGVYDWSDLRRRKEEPAAGRFSFTIHSTFHSQGETKR